MVVVVGKVVVALDVVMVEAVFGSELLEMVDAIEEVEEFNATKLVYAVEDELLEKLLL